MSPPAGNFSSAAVPKDRRASMATRDTGGQQKATRSREETDEVEASVDTEIAERHKEMTEDVDSLLDEIDEVLEENSARNSFGSTYKKGASERSLANRIRMAAKVLPGLRRATVPLATSPQESRSRDGLAFYCRDHLASAQQRSRDARRTKPLQVRQRPRPVVSRRVQVVSGLRQVQPHRRTSSATLRRRSG